MRIKIKNEEKASGISPTRSEVEEALEYLIEKEDASDEIHKNNMNRKDDMAERGEAPAQGPTPYPVLYTIVDTYLV